MLLRVSSRGLVLVGVRVFLGCLLFCLVGAAAAINVIPPATGKIFNMYLEFRAETISV